MKARSYELKLGTFFLGKSLGKQVPTLYDGPLSDRRPATRSKRS